VDRTSTASTQPPTELVGPASWDPKAKTPAPFARGGDLRFPHTMSKLQSSNSPNVLGTHLAATSVLSDLERHQITGR
jgi:hypothetical protein